MKYFKKLEGERIYLSQMSVEDTDTYVKWMSDFSVTDGLGSSSRLVSPESEKKWIVENADNYQFAIVRKEDNVLLGNCGLQEINQLHQCAEVGIFIGDEESRSMGYGSEALKLLTDYAFDYLNIRNVMLKVFSFNDRAISCYKKVGFKEIGRRRKSHYLRGQFYDEVFMDILREDRV